MNLARRVGDGIPVISIITTVYNRVSCLARCIQSVRSLDFRNHEHILVADCPPRNILSNLKRLVEASQEKSNVMLASLARRENDWGITPAFLGLKLSQGEYVCFLSDDNGYLPHHFNRLLDELESNPLIGFSYSSCLYDNRRILAAPIPARKHIDLGQPLFRRRLFDEYLGGTLPFSERAWDWRMIEHFINNGVPFSHINDATFVFRLANYPHLWPK
ncbi:MAG: glycosyltransferase [Edaphobacter sp.]|jgi:GT2 family glycosyltransferase